MERFKQNQIKGFQSNYSEPPRQQLTAGVPRLEDHGVLMLNQHQWKQKEIEREAKSRLALYKEFGNQVHQKSVGLQDVNIMPASVNSNSSEISRAMEKITETNQLIVQQQAKQQRALQALLMCQEQSNENQEITQRVQEQALRALKDATEQSGFNSLFNRIIKFDGKDLKKCQFWLNQVHVACMESGRNFRQALIICAEDTILSVLSGLNPGLSDEEIKEEMMRCFSPIPTKVEMMSTMCQGEQEQMHQYIMRHKVAHVRAHRLSPDYQLSKVEIIEFAMTLQPVIQDKLLKRIDGDRSPKFEGCLPPSIRFGVKKPDNKEI